MSPKGAIASKIAAAALAFSVMQSSMVMAGQALDDITEGTDTGVTQTEISQNINKGDLTNAWSVTINPLVPIIPLAGLGLLYGASCLYGSSRKMKGAWLRASAGGVLALTLMNPEILQEEHEALPTEVVIVVDRSASQFLDGRDKTTEEAYSKLIEHLSGVYGVNVRTVEVENADEGTQLISKMNTALLGVPRDQLGAVIMLTDGQVHDISDRLEVGGNDVPVHALVSGHDNEQDRRIVIEKSPRFGLVDESQTVSFRVVDEGAVLNTGDKVEVTISVDGKKVGSQMVVPGDLASVMVDVSHAGSNVVELSVEGLEGELTDTNNRIVASVDGIRGSMSVLLVSGMPNAGSRMWRDMLKSDPDTDLVHFTILYPPEKQDDVPLRELATIPFPTQEVFLEKLNDFDMVVLDNYNYQGILPPSYLRNVADYVKEGGSLFVVSGPGYAGNTSLYKTPLSSVLPAAPTGNVTKVAYKPAVTEMGMRHPVTRDLGGLDYGEEQWGQWFNIVDSKASPEGVIMEGAGKKPLLVLNRKEEGRVAMVLSDNAWLWAKGYDGGGPYAELFQRASRWLLKSPELEEESIHLRREGDNLVIEQQTMADENMFVTIRTPSGKTITVKPEAAGAGIWRSTIAVDEDGVYSAVQDDEKALKTFINVGADGSRELSDTLSTLDKIKPLVDEAGGRVSRMTDGAGVVNVPKIKTLSPDDSKLSAEDWIGVRMTQASVLKGTDRHSLVPGWLALVMAIGLMAGAYYREGERNIFGKKGQGEGGLPNNNKPSI